MLCINSFSSYLNVNASRSITELENLPGSFVNILLCYSFHLSCTEQASTEKITYCAWSERPFFPCFSRSSTQKLDVVCTQSCCFPYITKVSRSSLFQEKNQCQQPRLVAVTGFIKSKNVWSLEERKEISSWILDFLFCTWSSRKAAESEKFKVTSYVLVAPNSHSTDFSKFIFNLLFPN